MQKYYVQDKGKALLQNLRKVIRRWRMTVRTTSWSKGSVTPCQMDRKGERDIYPVMKVVPTAAWALCVWRMKRSMAAQLPSMYRTITCHLTEITERVAEKYRVKRKYNAGETEKTFLEHPQNDFVSVT